MTDNVQGNNSSANDITLDALAASLQVASKGGDGGGDPAPAKIELPDPAANPEEFKKAVEGLGSTVSQINSFLESQKAASAEQKIANDINSAVEFISNQVEGVDKRVIRGLVKDEADTNPTFRRIWESRDSNPDAYSKALGILARQYQEQFAPRVDPAVSADLRAFQESVRAARGHRADAIAAEAQAWDAKSDAEFDRDFMRLAGSQ
jgi:hypothetical protein